MAMPPCFMKKRRENFGGRTPSQQWLLIASPSSKFGSAEDEAGDDAEIDLFDGIVEASLDELWIVDLFAQDVYGAGRGLSGEENLDGAIESGAWVGGRVGAEERSNVGARAADF